MTGRTTKRIVTAGLLVLVALGLRVVQRESVIQGAIAAITQRESELVLANKELQRARMLLARELIPEQQVDEAVTKMRTAEAGLARRARSQGRLPTRWRWRPPDPWAERDRALPQGHAEPADDGESIVLPEGLEAVTGHAVGRERVAVPTQSPNAGPPSPSVRTVFSSSPTDGAP